MREMNVGCVMPRGKLVQILERQLTTHEKEWTVAMANWRKVMVDEAKKIKAAGKKLKAFPEKLQACIHPPTCHAQEIQEVIQMLKHSEEKEIQLTYEDYRKLVLGEWHWKHSFVETSTWYASNAR